MPIARPSSIYAGKTPWLLNCAHRQRGAAHPPTVSSIRHASTSIPRHNTDGSKTSTQKADLKDRVNPPISTLPSPISVPPRRQNQSYVSFLWTAGRAYVGFYKAGIKNIFTNRRVAATLRHRLNSTQTPQLPPSPNGNHKGLEASSTSDSYNRFVLSRAEFQILRRSRHDMIRVPIFGILFIILGEWLPLVAILFTPVLPYTCRIPRQIEGERQVLERRRKRSFRGEIDGNIPTPLTGADKRLVRTMDELSKGQLMHISRSLGLHIRLWDLSKGFLPPVVMLKPMVGRALAYLHQDDALLLRDGGIHKLTDEEVKIACEERGIDILGRNMADLRQTLRLWLKSQEAQTSPLPKLLSRPSNWKE